MNLSPDESLALLDPGLELVEHRGHRGVLKDHHLELLQALLTRSVRLVDGRDSLRVLGLLGDHWGQKGRDQLSHTRLEVKPLDLLRLDYKLKVRGVGYIYLT